MQLLCLRLIRVPPQRSAMYFLPLQQTAWSRSFMTLKNLILLLAICLITSSIPRGSITIRLYEHSNELVIIWVRTLLFYFWVELYCVKASRDKTPVNPPILRSSNEFTDDSNIASHESVSTYLMSACSASEASSAQRVFVIAFPTRSAAVSFTRTNSPAPS